MRFGRWVAVVGCVVLVAGACTPDPPNGDETKPVLSLPADLDVDATSALGAIVEFDATATDDVDGSVPVTCTPVSGSQFAVGSTTVECSASDAAGNTATGSFGVTVHDVTAPVLSVPGDIAVEATGPSGATVGFAASASDDVDGDVAVSCAPASGSVFALGVTTVECSASDAAGNVGTGSFTITVEDLAGPVLALPSGVTAEATSSAGAAVEFTTSAADVVDGDVAVACVPESGSVFALGETTVECSASDVAGNVTSGSFAVTVEDTTGPVVMVPDDISAEATDENGAVVDFTATASDAVDGVTAVTCTPASGSLFPVGDTTVECTSTDQAGNTSTASFTVTVTEAGGGPEQVVLSATGKTAFPPMNLDGESSFQLMAPSGTGTWSVVSGSFPVGITLSPDGVVSGTAEFGAGSADAPQLWAVTVAFDTGAGLRAGGSALVQSYDLWGFLPLTNSVDPQANLTLLNNPPVDLVALGSGTGFAGYASIRTDGSITLESDSLFIRGEQVSLQPTYNLRSILETGVAVIDQNTVSGCAYDVVDLTTTTAPILYSVPDHQGTCRTAISADGNTILEIFTDGSTLTFRDLGTGVLTGPSHINEIGPNDRVVHATDGSAFVFRYTTTGVFPFITRHFTGVISHLQLDGTSPTVPDPALPEDCEPSASSLNSGKLALVCQYDDQFPPYSAIFLIDPTTGTPSQLATYPLQLRVVDQFAGIYGQSFVRPSAYIPLGYGDVGSGYTYSVIHETTAVFTNVFSTPDTPTLHIDV